jgi:hypothetical protein
MTHDSMIDSLPAISPDALETVVGGKLPPGYAEALAAGEKAYQSTGGKKSQILSDAGFGDMGMGNQGGDTEGDLGGDNGTNNLGGDMGMGDMG